MKISNSVFLNVYKNSPRKKYLRNVNYAIFFESLSVCTKGNFYLKHKCIVKTYSAKKKNK